MIEHWETRKWRRDRSNGDYAYIKGNKRLYSVSDNCVLSKSLGAGMWQVSEIINSKPVYRNYNSFEEALEKE